MKVKELIAELEEFNPEDEVGLYDSEDFLGEKYLVTLNELGVNNIICSFDDKHDNTK